MTDDIEGVGSESFGTPDEQEPLELNQAVNTDDEPETGENGTGEGDEVDEAEAEPQRKKNPVQERIDAMYAKQKEAEKQAEYWKGVAEGRAKSEPQAEQQPEANAKPDPMQFEFGEADPAYIEALTDWKVETKLAAVEQRRSLTDAVQQLDSSYNQRLEAVREELPDYEEKVTLTAARGEWPCPEVIALNIKNSDVGPKVAYHLATNRDEAIAISHMSPIEQAVAFGRLEERIRSQPAPQPNIATNAPEPAPARTKGGQFASPSGLHDSLSMDEWQRRRNAQLRA